LKLNYDDPPSDFAFEFKLRRYKKAKEIASDFLELVEKIDYNKYFENMGTVTGAKAGGFLGTSTRPTSK
jgi:hypothetical protein